jgi:hypothetical protein
VTVVSMPCVRCGQPGYAPAEGHGLLCATHGGVPDAATVKAIVTGGGPSPLWRRCTGGFVAAGVAQAAIQAVNIWALRRADAPGFTTDVAAFARGALWVHLGLFLLWMLLAGSVATRLGHDRHAVLRHWTVLVWRVALVPTIVFSILAGRPGPTDPETAQAVDDNAVAFSAAQILTTALLVAYTVVVRRRLR